MIKFKKLHPDAVIPKRASDGAAGFDLYSATESVAEVNPGQRQIIHTGIAMAIPKGYVGLIRARSGLATKDGIEVMAGVIDSDYRGEVLVCLLNTQQPSRGATSIGVHEGMRIAQLLVVPCLQEAVEVEDLDATVRGDKGFGSTGIDEILTPEEAYEVEARTIERYGVYGPLAKKYGGANPVDETKLATVRGEKGFGSTGMNEIKLTHSFDAGAMAEHLQSDAGKEMILQVLRRNKASFREALSVDRADYWNPANILRHCAEQLAEGKGLEVDHESFDNLAKAMQQEVKANGEVYEYKEVAEVTDKWSNGLFEVTWSDSPMDKGDKLYVKRRR